MAVKNRLRPSIKSANWECTWMSYAWTHLVEDLAGFIDDSLAVSNEDQISGTTFIKVIGSRAKGQRTAYHYHQRAGHPPVAISRWREVAP